MRDNAHRQAKGIESWPERLGVALRQVVINGDHMHRHAGQGGCDDRQQGGQRFTFAGGHLHQASVQQRQATHDLHLVVSLAERSPGHFAHQREALLHQALGAALGLQGRAQSRAALFDLGRRQGLQSGAGAYHAVGGSAPAAALGMPEVQ